MAASRPDGRALALAPDEQLATWLTAELRRTGIELQIAKTLPEAMTALVGDGPTRPQMLIADFDALDAGEVLHLHKIRESGWFGAVIALGNVPRDLEKSLNIERVLARPLDGDALRRAVAAAGLVKATTKMIKFTPK